MTHRNHGRDGKFTPGNKAAKGNPHARQVAELRRALLDAVTPEEMRSVVAALVEKAKAGDVPAIKELFERTLGKPTEADLLERIERLEETLLEASHGLTRHTHQAA